MMMMKMKAVFSQVMVCNRHAKRCVIHNADLYNLEIDVGPKQLSRWCAGLAVLRDTASRVRSSSESLVEAIFPLGVNMGSDSIPQKLTASLA